jgi:hypothetical protein
VLIFLPLGVGVREGQKQPILVETPVVREGDFVMNLAETLSVGHPTSEAESMLGAIGIALRNGWIADYSIL